MNDIEIIVVNDGSSDNSHNIIKEYEQKYGDLIVYINQKNGGVSNARNNGLKAANGEYVFFLDSDDYLREDTFELLYNKAKEKNADVVVCDTMWVYENSDKKVSQAPYITCGDTMQKNYIVSVPNPWGKLIKKSLLDKMNFKFKEGIIYEDLAIIPAIGILAERIEYIREPLCYYLQRPGSIMHAQKYNEKFKNIYVALDELNNIFEKYNAKEMYKEELEFIHIEHLLRSASLRFLQYSEGKKEVEKIINIMHEKYPKYYKNIYFKNWSLKSKLICFFVYNKITILAKFIDNFKR